MRRETTEVTEHTEGRQVNIVLTKSKREKEGYSQKFKV